LGKIIFIRMSNRTYQNKNMRNKRKNYLHLPNLGVGK